MDKNGSGTVNYMELEDASAVAYSHDPAIVKLLRQFAWEFYQCMQKDKSVNSKRLSVSQTAKGRAAVREVAGEFAEVRPALRKLLLQRQQEGLRAGAGSADLFQQFDQSMDGLLSKTDLIAAFKCGGGGDGAHARTLSLAARARAGDGAGRCPPLAT
eukprot:548938-Prymnesium_polylepis.1